MDKALKLKIVKAAFGDGKPTPCEVIDLIAMYEAIQNELYTINSIEHKMLTRHAEEVKAIANNRMAVRGKCDHVVTDTQGDPAGGSDRAVWCVICQKDLR